MFVRSISILREGEYSFSTRTDPSKPFRATVEVQGEHGKIELRLSPELSTRVVAIIADEIAAAGRATAEAMTADIFTVAALPQPESEPAF